MECIGVNEMWTVMLKHSSEQTPFHKYLVLSRETSTAVLEAGQEFRQLENSQFYTSGPTVSVGVSFN